MASALKLVRLITAAAAFEGDAACARLRRAFTAAAGTPRADMLASEDRFVSAVAAVTAALAIALILPPVAITAAGGITASEPRLLFSDTNAGDWIVALAPGACASAE